MNAHVFLRTRRLLEGEPSRRWVARLALLIAFLGAWTAWLVLARVPVWVVSEKARLETEHAPFPVEAPVAGLVLRVPAVVGQRVAAGDVLLELDRATVERERESNESQAEALARKLAAIRAEEAAEVSAGAEELRTAESQVGVARAQLAEAEAGARLAAESARRTTGLHREQLASASDLERAQAETQQKTAAAEALRLSLQRVERDLKRAIEDRRVRREKLRGEAADVEAVAASAAGAAARLRDEGSKYVIRAPIPGRLGEIAALRAGSFVKAGDRLATVVPEGDVRVIAEFAPTDVAGRIGPGSPARLRLDGFPWIQYGHVRARVERVATELRDRRLRVELSLVPGQKTSIPLQHGLPGTAEIEAERVSPAGLLLRNAGRALDASGGSSATAATPTPAPAP